MAPTLTDLILNGHNDDENALGLWEKIFIFNLGQFTQGIKPCGAEDC